MPQNTIRVLLVEDNPDHAELAKRALFNQVDIILTVLTGFDTACEWLESNTPSLLISDLKLPDGKGMDFLYLDEIRNRFPIVILTSLGDEQVVVQAIKSGAQDYVVKSPAMYQDLGHIIRRTMKDWEHLTLRKQTEESLRESEARFRSIFENSPVGIFDFDRDGVVKACNDRLTAIIGSTRDKIVGQTLTDLPDAQLVKAVKEVLRGNRSYYDGNYHSISVSKITPVRGLFSPVFMSDGTISGGIGIIEDITEQKKAEKLQASIYKIAEAASSASDLQELYQEIHQIIKSLLPSDNLFIALWDQNKDEVSFPYFVDKYDVNPGPRKFGQGLTEYVLETGKPLLAKPEIYVTLENSEDIQLIGTPCVDWLGVPLTAADKKVLGAVVVQSYDEGTRYTEQDMAILVYVSSQIATMILRRMAEAAEHQQRLIAEALLDTTSALNSSLEMKEVFDRILTNLEKLTPYDSATVMLIEGEIAKTYSKRGRVEKGLDWENNFCWSEIYNFALIYKTGKPVILKDSRDDPYWLSLSGTDWIRSYAGIPLLSKGNVIGFLNLNSAEPGVFDPSESANKLQAFADQAAKAIENARLYAEVQRLAVIDDLTGLYNRRGFSELGKREIERSNRYDRRLSILFIDIDHFKNFNDQYSYAVGDQMLRLLAECLRANLREIDIIARYGGDEFMALLPEVNKHEAIEMAEELIMKIRSLRYSYGSTELQISSSIGVYSVSQTDIDLDTLVAKAGELLHQAKVNGKNRVWSI